MNKQIKQRWVAALRSGEYTQGRGKLHKFCGSFCTLGVLVDLAVQDKICEWGENDCCKENEILIDDTRGYYELLPQRVIAWAGLDSDNPRINDGDNCNSITWMNDEKEYSFSQIATLIEEQL